MEQVMKKKSLFVRKCLQLFIIIYVYLWSSDSFSYSCKVEREGKDTILSDNCIKQNDGKVLVTFCNNSGKCLASNAVEAPGYKCQTTSPGTPGFCIEYKQAVPPNATEKFIPFNKSEFASIEDQDTYQIIVQNDREFADFKNLILVRKTKATNGLYLIYGKDKSVRAACSLSGRRLADLATAESIPSCDAVGNQLNDPIFSK